MRKKKSDLTLITQMKKRKRINRFMIAGSLAAVFLFVCTGCNADTAKQDIESTPAENETTEQKSEISTASDSPEAVTNQEPSTDCENRECSATEETAKQEPSGSFKVTYQGQEAKNAIELRHCDRVYDAHGIRIYAKYIYWLMVPETFPSEQYVLYIETPQEQIQLYPIADFLVDKEQGILYTKIAGDDGFESVQCIFLTEENGLSSNAQRELFNAEQAEKMLCDAYGRNGETISGDTASDFSNITVELTEIETGSAGILHGETGGIEKATGQRYYVNWEIDTSGNIQNVTPCILKQYDSDKDREIFADSSRIFDQIEQGDWSCVKPIDELDYLWGMSEGKWLRMDVNGDGLPELINGYVIDEMPDYETDEKIEIALIFTYRDQMAELVYVDVNDGMEYLFITGNGNLVYEWGVSGGPCTVVLRLCRFDLKWNKEYLDTLVRYRFPEGDEGLEEYYREHFPDTYGIGGEGIYYLRERPKTEKELEQNADEKYVVREYLTEEQFLSAYEEMTGWDFYKAEWMYSIK